MLVDLDNDQAAVCKRVGRSWQNHRSADIALQLADSIREFPVNGAPLSVAIIAPYRAQVKLLNESIRHREESVGIWSNVTVGTVHQFQGSEADVVIFDLVDGPGRPSLGRLLIGDGGVRLTNVAVTRARGKLILLLNRRWTRHHMERDQNPLLCSLASDHAGTTRVYSDQIM